MKTLSFSRAAAAFAVCVAPVTAVIAQPAWVPGAEITGQSVQVTTNGVTDTVMFGPGGQATITTPGGRVVPATWSAAGGNLCLSANGGQECWPYARPFMAGQQVALTSNCGSADTFLAPNTNAPMPRSSGERG
jgi:hypothetical protein